MNQPMYFFLPCAWLIPLLVHHVVMLTPSLRCVGFFNCLFLTLPIFSPVINQTSLSQTKSLFLFILLCRREKYRWTCPLGLRINYTNMSWEQFIYSLKNYLSVIILVKYIYNIRIAHSWKLLFLKKYFY